ncbi:MAG: formate dehydrogenase accessory sulfurtransferase FdhD, partial [Pseudomonadota bacterium]|nr:formate dehydrogenase accessory sulfurtransferase FdhD [Pseudomonadota bacterium]
MEEISIIQNVTALDEQGQSHCISVAHELPLTLKVDNKTIITLMTLGHHPKALAVGYLRNQKFIHHFNEIKSITIHWQTKTIEVVTYKGINSKKPAKNDTIKSSCSLGMMLSVNELPSALFSPIKIKQSFIDTLLKTLT